MKLTLSRPLDLRYQFEANLRLSVSSFVGFSFIILLRILLIHSTAKLPVSSAWLNVVVAKLLQIHYYYFTSCLFENCLNTVTKCLWARVCVPFKLPSSITGSCAVYVENEDAWGQCVFVHSCHVQVLPRWQGRWRLLSDCASWCTVLYCP